MIKDERILRDAQYRKGLSIAFFNATNSAISLCQHSKLTDKKLLDKVTKFRKHFMDEYKEYYAETIANIGGNYKVDDTISRLEAATNYEELKSVYLSLSEDERRDGEVIKKAQELKKKYYEKA